MAPRLELQALLISLLGSGNVYFQPPATVQMEFPCIVYRRSNLHTDFANNSPYRMKKRYQITYIDEDPDGDVSEKLAALPLCSFDRFFVVDNLNHDVYNVFF